MAENYLWAGFRGINTSNQGTSPEPDRTSRGRIPMSTRQPRLMLLLLLLIAFEASAYGLDGQIEIRTPMPPPSWALLERELIKANASGVRDLLRPLLRRPWLARMCRALGGRRRTGRRHREPYPLADPLRPRRPRFDPAAVHERLGGAPSPVHPREDRRCPDGTRRDVLQGVPRHVRLAPQRRGPHGL